MNRTLPALLGFLLLAALPEVQAQFNYTTNNGEITITGYTGPGGAVTIPTTINGLPVTSIGDYAFDSHYNLTSVTIGNGVISIGNYAFEGCGSLTSVMIPNSVMSIGYFTFYGSGLASATIPSSVTSIGDAAFGRCYSLAAINVDAANSFYGSVAGILFDKGQTTLIQHPVGITGSYTIPNSVTSIGYIAFIGCSGLTNITIPDSVTSIGGGAFIDCSGLTVAIIPNSVTSIAAFTFEGCISLTNAIIGNSATNIGDSAFSYCTSLTGITIPNSVTTIGDNAFNNCTSLINITIPDNITSIGGGAFYGCGSLTNVNIGRGVTNIGDGVFYYCASMTAINVDAANLIYSSVSGVLFDHSQTTLIVYPGGKVGSYTIPNGVTSIGSGAFSGCIGLTRVTIPNSVTSIGHAAFNQCGSLTSVTIPDSVTSITDAAFAFCFNLNSIYFLGNAPSVGFDVFIYSNNLTVYHLPWTTGWDTYFGGHPTALWLPQVQTGDASFGVRSNQFGFNINWASGQTVVVEACTNLTNPLWSPVSTNTLTSGSSYFSDPQWTNYPARFYQLRQQ